MIWRAKIFGRVIVNTWATNSDFKIDVTGLEIGDLERLQQAADAALYDGKHSGHAVLADARHATHPSINGRRAGRPGTGIRGRAA